MNALGVRFIKHYESLEQQCVSNEQCDVFAVFAAENLGVRVENTVLITETGCENLTPGIPREISEIEALMKIKGAGQTGKK